MGGMRLPNEALILAIKASGKAKKEISEGNEEHIADVLYSAWISVLGDLLAQNGDESMVRLSGVGATCLALLGSYFECAGDWDKMNQLMTKILVEIPEQ